MNVVHCFKPLEVFVSLAIVKYLKYSNCQKMLCPLNPRSVSVFVSVIPMVGDSEITIVF